MPPLTHILFPYDFSPRADAVAPFVAALARRFAARVTLLGVVPPTFDPVPAGMGPLHVGVDADAWRRALQERLNGALRAELTGFAVQRTTTSGEPARKIVEAAQHDVDLIMMPTHGVGLFRRMLIGSVTSKVLHDAGCPVWTAVHGDTQSAAHDPRIILCAVDDTDGAPALLRWSADFASRWGADLRVLHVVEPITDWPSLASEQRRQQQVRDQERDDLAAAMAAAGVSVPARVAVGEIVATVTEQARQEQADLLIVGRQTLGEDFGRLRAHTFGIVQRSPCPVLNV